MKVLKEGKWHLPWSAELPCATCEAVLLVEEADVKATDYDSSGGYHAVCPICTRAVVVPKNGLPLRMTDALGKKRKYTAYHGRD